MQMTRGKVPHFTMRPHPLVTGALIMVLVVGILLGMSFLAKEDGSGVNQRHGILTFIVTAIFSFFLVIVATAKFWYTHLWKKNSTHARHKQHTKHHPAMREKQFREQRHHQKR